MDQKVWKQWLTGYCQIRQFAPLDIVPEGFFLEVGKRQQSGRYFFPHCDKVAFRQFMTLPHEACTYVEVPTFGDELANELRDGWRLVGTSFFMSCDLRTHPKADDLDGDYTLAISVDQAVARVSIRAASGEWAAGGTCLVQGGHAIFDEISTAWDHQRLGLGRAVVSKLADWAAKSGGETGLLVGTPDGRQLYAALGWTLVSEVTTAISPCVFEKAGHDRALLVAA